MDSKESTDPKIIKYDEGADSSGVDLDALAKRPLPKGCTAVVYFTRTGSHVIRMNEDTDSLPRTGQQLMAFRGVVDRALSLLKEWTEMVCAQHLLFEEKMAKHLEEFDDDGREM